MCSWSYIFTTLSSVFHFQVTVMLTCHYSSYWVFFFNAKILSTRRWTHTHTHTNIHTHTHMQRDTWNLCRRGFGLSYCLSKFHMLLHILDSGLLVYDFHRPISGCLRKIDHTQLLVYDFHRPVPGCLSKIDHTQWQNLLSTALFAPETKLITVSI